MNLKDYNYYKKTGKYICKSQIKDFIELYATILEKVKKESAPELDGVKINIKRSYPKEVYLTLTDEKDSFVKFTLTEKTKDYIIPIFTDICEFNEGSEKISKLFLDKLSQKLISNEDLNILASEDEHFRGVVINPHSQNFRIDREGNI